MAPISLLFLATTALAIDNVQFKALPNAPNGYTPVAGDCPTTRPTLRTAQGLSSSETSWLALRRNVTIDPMTKLLGSMNISGFDAASYIKNQTSNVKNLPNIGIAVSGGGYRAMLTGAGAIKAYDSRENSAGGLGGLLQSSTYVAGLSGGGWLVGSVFLNNFTTISALQSRSGELWNLSNTIFEGPEGTQAGQMNYYATVDAEVTAKQEAGFNTSITDIWGRTLAYQFINATRGGLDYTWSSIRDQPGFPTGDIPFPLVVADGRVDNQTAFPSTNTTVYEFSPYELGSWDPTTYGFVDLQFVGSNFSNGKLPDDQKCVRGYDNAGLIIGTTSSIFTSLAATFVSSQIPKDVAPAFADIIEETREDQGFVAHFSPNPFQDWNPTGQAQDSELDTLYLVDGGTDGQNLPLAPLIQPARAVDVIVAIDASNDVSAFPNGAAMVETYKRAQGTFANGTKFAMVPDKNTFINLGLNKKPTFFGCNATDTPLIVYVPNAPYTAASNTSTFQLEYTYEQRDALISNGALVATQGNGTANTEFRACLGCAILARSFTRTKTAIPAACQTCFKAYCWNGTVSSANPAVEYSPALIGASPAGLGLNVTGGSRSPSGTGSSNSSSTTPNGGAAIGGASTMKASGFALAGCILSALLYL